MIRFEGGGVYGVSIEYTTNLNAYRWSSERSTYSYSTVQYTSVLNEDSEDDVCVFPVAAYVMTSKNIPLQLDLDS